MEEQMPDMPAYYYTAYEYRPVIRQWITNCGVETDEDTVIEWLEVVAPDVGAENVRIVFTDTKANTSVDVTKQLLTDMAARFAARADDWEDVPFWLIDYAPEWVRDAQHHDYIKGC
jgi:hypothetical protein